jgi:hypothetical protein
MLGDGWSDSALQYRLIMDEYTHALRLTMVEAYPTYVASLLVARGVEMTDVVADSIVEGAHVLDGLLTTLEQTPPSLQRHSPLELFRESLRPVTKALSTVGAREVVRDPEQSTLLPWDTFGLSPASTSAISDEVHAAHLEWGLAKAAALGTLVERKAPERPLLWFVCRDSDTEALLREGERVGYRMLPAPQWDRPVAVLIDMGVDDSTDLLGLAVNDGHRVVVYDDAVDDIRAIGFRAAGAWKVSSRDDVMHRLGTIRPVLA